MNLVSVELRVNDSIEFPYSNKLYLKMPSISKLILGVSSPILDFSKNGVNVVVLFYSIVLSIGQPWV